MVVVIRTMHRSDVGLAFMGTGHSAQPCASQQLDAGLATHVLYPHVSISDSRPDVVSVSGSMHSYEENPASVAQFICQINHRKHPRHNCIFPPCSYAIYSGLSEISLCIYRSFYSTNADLGSLGGRVQITYGRRRRRG